VLLRYSKSLFALLDSQGNLLEWNASIDRLKNQLPTATNIKELLVSTSVVRFREMMDVSLQEQRIVHANVHFAVNEQDLPTTYECYLTPTAEHNILLFAEPIPALDEKAAQEYLRLTNELSTTTRQLYKTQHILSRKNEELQKAWEQAELATRAKSEFLANMSHEIRTPLNAILGFTNLLLHTHLNAEQYDYAESTRASSEILLSIINDILDFSKIEAGMLELEHHAFDLRYCIEEALDLVAYKASEKRINVSYIIDEHTPTSLLGDVTRLRQIIVNLLSNAVKFTDQGEVVVTVSSRVKRIRDRDFDILPESHYLLPINTAPAPRYEISITVRDTGIGIPAERLRLLFRSFTQVDASTTRKYGGTGLGLAISKRLAEMMGGTIWVESEMGQGSCFHIIIEVEEDQQTPHFPDFLKSDQPELAKKRVLLIENNKTQQEFFLQHLTWWGMQLSLVSSEAEAIGRLESGETFDVIVVDMNDPLADDEPTMIHALRTSSDDTPLILWIPIRLAREYSEAYDDPNVIFLIKPVKLASFYQSLLSVCAKEQETSSGMQTSRGRPFQGRREIPNLATTIPLRILVAEDNAVNQKVITRLLDRMGYRADLAANGIEAIDMVKRLRYNVVFMDVQMPDMDGIEATGIIRQQISRHKQPRIIAMTAHSLQGDRERLLNAGMDDYISKPMHIEQLVRVLERCQDVSD
jgi:signal transduction histidine kinase/CheY-like chemotaxis protein